MTTIDLAPFERAISAELCKPCAQADDRGACCRPGGQPCALTAHADVIVQTVTRLGRGKSADEYSHALERSLCPTCRSDVTGYCSLLELMIDKPDAYLLRVVDVVLGVQEGLRGETGVTS